MKWYPKKREKKWRWYWLCTWVTIRQIRQIMQLFIYSFSSTLCQSVPHNKPFNVIRRPKHTFPWFCASKLELGHFCWDLLDICQRVVLSSIFTGAQKVVNWHITECSTLDVFCPNIVPNPLVENVFGCFVKKWCVIIGIYPLPSQSARAIIYHYYLFMPPSQCSNVS